MSKLTKEESPQPEPDHIEEEANPRVVEYLGSSSAETTPKVTDALLTFYEMMKVDEELTEIEEEKGDLPHIIEKQKANLKKLTKDLEDVKSQAGKYTDEVEKLTKENKTSEERIGKYDQEKYNVKNNKEYDDIVKSIDKAFEVVEKNDKRLKEIDGMKDNMDTKQIEMQTKQEELETELKENEATLSELNSQFEQEEKELKSKKKKLLTKLDDSHKTLYQRINGNHKGEAVGLVRNGNCSGCFNSIPPQREIEIRTAEKIFTCQACGRILVDEHLVNGYLNK